MQKITLTDEEIIFFCKNVNMQFVFINARSVQLVKFK